MIYPRIKIIKSTLVFNTTSGYIMKKLLLFLTILVSIFIGCKEDPTKPVIVEPSTLQIGLNDIEISFDGRVRDFIVQIPAGFQVNQAYPVVFFFHGLGGNKNFGRDMMRSIADNEGFIGIYPQGYLNSWNAGSGGVPSLEDDVGFTLEMLNWLGEEVIIDETRVYSMGYSNGGAFSYRLARDTDVFAAIASISASHFEGITIPAEASKLSVLQIHGRLDTVVPYEGGKSINLDIIFDSAMNTVTSWAVHNGLSANPVTEYPEQNLTLYKFSSNGNPYEVLLYCLENANHNPTVHPFVGSERCYQEIWEFFQRHPKY
jgi:polyhydroxybutyrate depolymerase